MRDRSLGTRIFWKLVYYHTNEPFVVNSIFLWSCIALLKLDISLLSVLLDAKLGGYLTNATAKSEFFDSSRVNLLSLVVVNTVSGP